MNGSCDKLPPANSAKPVAARNFKLLIDPIIQPEHRQKVYRYEGVVPNDPAASVVVVRDPRSRLTALSKRLEAMDIPVPR
jgi:hypothetical protein